MPTHHLRKRFAVSLTGLVAATAAGLLMQAGLSARSSHLVWLFGDLQPVAACTTEVQIFGFEYDPQGRPVIGWREDNGCGSASQAFWARREQGVWQTHEIGGLANASAYQLALRKTDGAPFVLASASGPFSGIYTYLTDLEANPNGGNWQQLEGLGSSQSGPSANYSLAFGPAATAPNWSLGIAYSNGRGPVRLDGVEIEPSVGGAAASVAVGADGTTHLLYFGGPTQTFPGGVYYTQGAQSDPEVAWRGRGIALLANVTTSSAGADVQIRVDGAGTLHAVARVPDNQGGFGGSWYFRSTDNGHSWSAPEPMVGPWTQLHSLTVDGTGTPAVTYWDGWTQLRYTSRDSLAGTWPSELITPTLYRASPSPRLALDPNAAGQPVVVFYDAATRRLRTARPMSSSDPDVPPADLAVSVVAAPNPVPSGSLQAYTFTVRNQSPRLTTGTVLTVTLPATVTLVSASQTPTSQVGQVLTFSSWAVGGGGFGGGLLAAGASGTVVVTVQAGATGPGVVTASVVAAEPEATPSDNSALALINIYPLRCFPTPVSLKAWWPAESAREQIADVPTTLEGGVSFAAGKVGQAFSLDGSTGWVSTFLLDDNYFYPRSNSFSISAWIRTGKTTGSQTIVSKHLAAYGFGGLAGYFFTVEDGKLSMWIRDAAGGISSVAGTALVADDVFHHVAAVRDVAGGQLLLYVDGALDAAVSTAGGATGDIGSLSGDRDALGIGSSGVAGVTDRTAFFQGLIDDVTWYSVAISASDLAAMVAARDKAACGAPLAPGTIVENGTFDQGLTEWQQYATPDLSYIVAAVTAGRMEFHRVPPPPGTANQATVFQHTSVPVPASTPLIAQFDLGNSSPVRKRVSVLVLDSDFSDLSVCTFWIPPSSTPQTYQMRTHTTKAWINASIYFYAATAGSDGGAYLVDNVSLGLDGGGSGFETTCHDPTAPAPPGGPDGAEMLVNGNFSAALAGWALYGQISQQVVNGVFEFFRPSATPDPAGVILQPTGQGATMGEVLTATFDLGNSSPVRKRVTVILHDLSFSDLSACTFWLAPGQVPATYTMRSFATQPWTNATVSIYAASVGNETWTRLDNVSLKRTPGGATTGTTCAEPGS